MSDVLVAESSGYFDPFISAAMRSKILLPVISIYFSPADYPNKYVARLFHVAKGSVTPTHYVFVADTLEEVRTSCPATMRAFQRHPDDPRCLVETWV